MFLVASHRIFKGVAHEVRNDDVVAIGLNGVRRITGGDHFLVDLLAGANSDDLLLAAGGDRGGDIGNAIRGDFWNEDFSAEGVLGSIEDHVDAFIE